MKFRKCFHTLKIGRPLLTESADYEAVCRAILKQFPKLKKEEALVLMGHGTGHFADSAYAALDYRFKACLLYTSIDHPDIVQISAARAKKAGNYHMMTGQNPVFILTGQRLEHDHE